MGKSETEGDLQCSHDPKLRQVFSPIEQSDPMQMMGQDAKPDLVNTWPRLASFECLIAGSALLLLLAAQWLLSSVILGRTITAATARWWYRRCSQRQIRRIFRRHQSQSYAEP